jgi:hypothetical protein
MFLRNVRKVLPDNTASYTAVRNSNLTKLHNRYCYRIRVIVHCSYKVKLLHQYVGVCETAEKLEVISWRKQYNTVI